MVQEEPLIQGNADAPFKTELFENLYFDMERVEEQFFMDKKVIKRAINRLMMINNGGFVRNIEEGYLRTRLDYKLPGRINLWRE